jgi:hypothetical protein
MYVKGYIQAYADGDSAMPDHDQERTAGVGTISCLILQ